MDQAVLALRLILSLAVVLGLIWVLAKKFGKIRQSGDDGEAIAVVSRQSLSRTTGVAVVTIGHRRILVGFGEQQVTMLTELGPASAPSVAAAAPALSSVPPVGAALSTELATLAMMTGGAAAAPLPGSAAAGSANARARAAAVAASVTSQRLGSRTGADLTSMIGATALQSVPMTGTAGHAGLSAVDGSGLGAVPQVTLPASVQAHLQAQIPQAQVSRVPAAAGAARGARTPAAATGRDPLAGSVLSPTTWRRTVAALQERTVRR